VAEPSALAGRVVAVGAADRAAERRRGVPLERGPLAVSITIDGIPISDLPAGTRLRLGAVTIVEVSGQAALRQVGAREGSALGLIEADGSGPIAADVVEAGPVAPGDPVSLEAIALPLTDVLDLHSFSPRDMPEVVVTYLQEARRAGLAEVRIVHGRGRGVQRAVVRRVLRETPGVAAFADAPPAQGGWGATIVRLVGMEHAPSA
jgi:Smr domain-containing protein